MWHSSLILFCFFILRKATTKRKISTYHKLINNNKKKRKSLCEISGKKDGYGIKYSRKTLATNEWKENLYILNKKKNTTNKWTKIKSYCILLATLYKCMSFQIYIFLKDFWIKKTLSHIHTHFALNPKFKNIRFMLQKREHCKRQWSKFIFFFLNGLCVFNKYLNFIYIFLAFISKKKI